MIKTVIIDDEKDARYILRNQLENYFSDRVIILGEASDVREGVQLIQALKPNVVFLDIQMKSGTGFTLLQELNEINFEIIFFTAHDEHAIKAFKYQAFAYLLKPLKRSELEETIVNLEKKLSTRVHSEGVTKVLIEKYGQSSEIHKLIIPNQEGFNIVEISEILRLEGDRNYTHFHLSNSKKITTSRSLGEYQGVLEGHGFYRIHQSTIVSLRHVVKYLKGDGGEVEMRDGKRFKVSRARKAEFIKRFN